MGCGISFTGGGEGGAAGLSATAGTTSRSLAAAQPNARRVSFRNDRLEINTNTPDYAKLQEKEMKRLQKKDDSAPGSPSSGVQLRSGKFAERHVRQTSSASMPEEYRMPAVGRVPHAVEVKLLSEEEGGEHMAQAVYALPHTDSMENLRVGFDFAADADAALANAEPISSHEVVEARATPREGGGKPRKFRVLLGSVIPRKAERNAAPPAAVAIPHCPSRSLNNTLSNNQQQQQTLNNNNSTSNAGLDLNTTQVSRSSSEHSKYYGDHHHFSAEVPRPTLQATASTRPPLAGGHVPRKPTSEPTATHGSNRADFSYGYVMSMFADSRDSWAPSKDVAAKQAATFSDRFITAPMSETSSVCADSVFHGQLPSPRQRAPAPSAKISSLAVAAKSSSSNDPQRASSAFGESCDFRFNSFMQTSAEVPRGDRSGEDDADVVTDLADAPASKRGASLHTTTTAVFTDDMDPAHKTGTGMASAGFGKDQQNGSSKSGSQGTTDSKKTGKDVSDSDSEESSGGGGLLQRSSDLSDIVVGSSMSLLANVQARRRKVTIVEPTSRPPPRPRPTPLINIIPASNTNNNNVNSSSGSGVRQALTSPQQLLSPQRPIQPQNGLSPHMNLNRSPQQMSSIQPQQQQKHPQIHQMPHPLSPQRQPKRTPPQLTSRPPQNVQLPQVPHQQHHQFPQSQPLHQKAGQQPQPVFANGVHFHQPPRPAGGVSHSVAATTPARSPPLTPMAQKLSQNISPPARERIDLTPQRRPAMPLARGGVSPKSA